MAATKRAISKERISAMIDKLRTGQTLMSITAEEGVDYSGIITRIYKDHDLALQCSRARELGSLALVDEAQHRLDACTDPAQMIIIREQVQHLRWRAKMHNRHQYGDKVSNELSGPGGKPIETSIKIEFVDSDSDK